MEKYSSKKIDEFRRLILPIELRARMGLGNKKEETEKFYITLQKAGHIIVMQPAKEDTPNALKIDELGRIKFPIELMEEMGWGIRKAVEIYYVDEKMAIFK